MHVVLKGRAIAWPWPVLSCHCHTHQRYSGVCRIQSVDQVVEFITATIRAGLGMRGARETSYHNLGGAPAYIVTAIYGAWGANSLPSMNNL